MNQLLQDLSPSAQILLFVCLMLMLAGLIVLLCAAAFSTSVTVNLCKLFSSIAQVFRRRVIVEIVDDVHQTSHVSQKFNVVDQSEE